MNVSAGPRCAGTRKAFVGAPNLPVPRGRPALSRMPPDPIIAPFIFDFCTLIIVTN